MVGAAGGGKVTLLGLVAFVVLSALYLVFIAVYSVNGLMADDWSFVHLVHLDVTGRLTLGELWMAHGGHRMLVPNLLLVQLARVTHDNAKTTIVISTALLIVGFAIYLSTARAYLRRRLTLPIVAVLGLIWFSLADLQNALWAFQFAWYLILLLLMVQLALLLAPSVGDDRAARRFILALVVTVLASYSSFQGLLLWPVGLVALAWDLSWPPQGWNIKQRVQLGVWVVVGAVVTAVYFLVGRYSGGQFIIDDWVHIPQSILANIGDVIPTNVGNGVAHSAIYPGLHEIVGAVLLVVSVGVVVMCVRDRATEQRNPLPACLIVFAVLFDISVSTSHLLEGVGPTLAGRYEMANLLVPLALVTFAITRMTAAPARRWAIMAVVSVLVAVQVVFSTVNGFHYASHQREAELTANRILVNRASIPASEHGCYSLTIFDDAGVLDTSEINEAAADRLSMFSSGPFERNRTEGLPVIHC